VPYEPDERLIAQVVVYLKAQVATNPEWLGAAPEDRATLDDEHSAEGIYTATARAIIIAEHQRGGLEGVQGFRREIAAWLRDNPSP